AASFLRHEVFHRGDGLLVGRGAGVEDVGAELLALVLDRVVEQPVQLLEDREDRLPRDRGPATEHGRNLVLGQQLPRLLREQGPVGGRVDDDWLDLLAQETALRVELLDGHQRDVLQRRLADRHGSRQGMEDADLDGLLGACFGGEEGEGTCQRCEPEASVHRSLSFGPVRAGQGRLQAMDHGGASRLARKWPGLTFGPSANYVGTDHEGDESVGALPPGECEDRAPARMRFPRNAGRQTELSDPWKGGDEFVASLSSAHDEVPDTSRTATSRTSSR